MHPCKLNHSNNHNHSNNNHNRNNSKHLLQHRIHQINQRHKYLDHRLFHQQNQYSHPPVRYSLNFMTFPMHKMHFSCQSHPKNKIFLNILCGNFFHKFHSIEILLIVMFSLTLNCTHFNNDRNKTKTFQLN